MPVVGICRGIQFVNVALGGSLLQDVGVGTIHNVADDNTAMTEYGVRMCLAPNWQGSSVKAKSAFSPHIIKPPIGSVTA